ASSSCCCSSGEDEEVEERGTDVGALPCEPQTAEGDRWPSAEPSGDHQERRHRVGGDDAVDEGEGGEVLVRAADDPDGERLGVGDVDAVGGLQPGGGGGLEEDGVGQAIATDG